MLIMQRNNPFEQMNRLFEQTRRSMWGGPEGGRQLQGEESWGAGTTFHIEETDEGYVVVADLPGFEREDLDVRFEDGVLTVQGETGHEEESGLGTHRRQRRVHKRVTVPGSAAPEDVTASYHNGVLEVTIPVEADAEDTHRIDIE
jgi:HSP20 family protein